MLVTDPVQHDLLMVKLNNLKCCHKCHVVVRYVRKSWGRLQATRDSCGTIPGRVTASVEEVAILRSEWVFCAWGMYVIYVWAIYCVGLLDTLKVRMHVLVTANICLCGENRFSRSVLRSHPSCLLQDWISFPKSSDSPWDLHSCECQSHRMRNRISCCSFIIEASKCSYEKWTAGLFGYTGLIIYSNLNQLFWLVKSFPMILSWFYRLLLMIPPQAQTN